MGGRGTGAKRKRFRLRMQKHGRRDFRPRGPGLTSGGPSSGLFAVRAAITAGGTAALAQKGGRGRAWEAASVGGREGGWARGRPKGKPGALGGGGMIPAVSRAVGRGGGGKQKGVRGLGRLGGTRVGVERWGPEKPSAFRALPAGGPWKRPGSKSVPTTCRREDLGYRAVGKKLGGAPGFLVFSRP